MAELQRTPSSLFCVTPHVALAVSRLLSAASSAISESVALFEIHSFFLRIRIILFGGMILSVIMAYIASLFYKVFTIRGNDPWYFMSLINEEKSKNKNQPLLAFTFWFLAFMFFAGGIGVVSSFM